MTIRHLLELLVRRASFGVGLVSAVLLVVFLATARAEEGKALKGVALVVGQSAYEHLSPLPNPKNDARAIDDLLSDLGFEVDMVADADQKKLARSLERFIEDAAEADVALIYYSGHGIEAAGENFLVPVDADVGALDEAGKRLQPLSAMIAQLQATVPVTIVLLDACRSNPFPPGALVRLEGEAAPVAVSGAGLGVPRGATALKASDTSADGLGAVLSFAAAPGQVALDGDAGGNSPYAAALIKHLSAGGFAFSDVMTMVTEEVWLKTSARQMPWTNTSLRKLLYFGGTAENEADEEALIRGERRKLLLTIASIADSERKQVASAARDGDVPMDALFAMLKAVGADIPQNPDQLSRLLEDQASRLKTLLAERDTLTNSDPEIERLANLAGQAITEGALQTAITFREKAKERAVELDATLDQAETNLQSRRIEHAAVFAASAETYALAYNHTRAAEDFASAFGQVERWDKPLALRYKLAEARALSDLAYFRADDGAADRSLAAYRQAVALAPAVENPDGWAEAQSGLAMTMWAKGERQETTGQLEESAAILRAAIASPELAGQTVALASLQGDLSLVLLSLGMREPGTERLEESAEAARNAIKLITRDSEPEQWARLHNHLGSTLFLHGLREQTQDRVRESALAFRAALEIWTADERPIDWANAQNNLALALGELGAREPGSDQLLEAVELLKSALEVRTRETAPLHWAESLTNLAATYYQLGLRDQTTRYFDDSAVALEQALQEITRPRDPLKWAAIQENLGLAHSNIGARTGKTEPLEKATEAYEAALSVRTRERVPLDWAQTQNNLGNVYYRLGEFNHDAEKFHQAVAAFEAVLEERTRERSPKGWASTQNNLANAFAGLGGLEEGTENLKKAVEHYRLSIEVQTLETDPINYADGQYNLSLTLLELSQRTGAQEDFDAARAALNASRDVYHAAGQMQYDKFFNDVELAILISETEATVARKLKELEQ